MQLEENLIQRVNVGDSLTRSAALRPGRPALVDGGRRFTYAELNAWVNRLAHGLSARGYGRGDALALASGNSAEFLAVYYACAKLGVVCVPINLGWRPDEVAYVLRHSRARGLVVETQLVGAMTEALAKATDVADVLVAPGTGARYASEPADRRWAALADVEAADEAEPSHVVDDRDALSYLYTSGTTSFPKGVVGSHLAIYLESMSGALESGWNAADRFVAMMPMFHTAQLNAFCTPAVMVGATIHVLRGFDPAALLDMVERERITQVFGLPMMFRADARPPVVRRAGPVEPAPGGLRDGTDARRADPRLPRGLRLRVRAAVRPDRDEPGHHAVPPRAPAHPHRRGRHPDRRRAGRDHGPGRRAAAPGEQGEIVYRGPSTMNGYLHDPEATAEAFAHGWFHSGDVGRFDDDGVLWFADRYKDVIKTGGENVASIEVEKAVYAADPRVAEVVVVGLPHERWSEAITAVVVPKPGETLDGDGLRAALGQRLDGYKVPKAVIVVDELPRTSTGKIQKNVVRERHATYYEER